MTQDRDSIGKSSKGQLIEKIIRQKINELKPGIDWSQVSFRKDIRGKIVGMESGDLRLHAWLQLIIIGV